MSYTAPVEKLTLSDASQATIPSTFTSSTERQSLALV